MPRRRHDGSMTMSEFFWVLVISYFILAIIEQRQSKSMDSEILKENCTITTTRNVNVLKTRVKKGFSFRKYIQRTPEIEYYTDIEQVTVTTCCHGYQWQADTNFCEPFCYPNCFDDTTVDDYITETTIENDEMQAKEEQEEEVEKEEVEEVQNYETTAAVIEEMFCPEDQMFYNGTCISLDDCHLIGCSIDHSICSDNGDCVCENDYDSHTEESKLVKCVAKEKTIVVDYDMWPNIYLTSIVLGSFMVSAIILLIFYKRSRKPRNQAEVEGKNLQCVYMKVTDAATSKDVVFRKEN